MPPMFLKPVGLVKSSQLMQFRIILNNKKVVL
jgi:hypothetical protein